MKFTSAIVLAVASATTAIASPAIEVRAPNPPNIGFGQQLQNTDQANHWVTW